MRALLIDDEEPARLAMKRLLGAFAGVEVAGEAGNALEAMEQVEALRPDVLFLDVEMPGMNGFQLLAQLQETPLVIFVTAFDRYAIDAFEANAVDYLLKPVQTAALDRAIGRVQERIQAGKWRFDPAVLRQLQATLQLGAPTKLAARRGKRIALVRRKDILYVEAQDKLVFIHTADEKLLTDRTVTELEAMLPPGEFVRVNRATLVNLEAVEELYPWLASGSWRVRLRSGVELEVSRERAKSLRELLGL